jgi:hypothetical protein
MEEAEKKKAAGGSIGTGKIIRVERVETRTRWRAIKEGPTESMRFSLKDYVRGRSTSRSLASHTPP